MDEWATGPGKRAGAARARVADTVPGYFDIMVRRPDRWSRILIGTTLAGLLFGVVGPYNSFTANPITRLCYWILLFWAGTLILWPSAAWGLQAGARRGFPPLFAAATALLVASIPLAAFAAAACYLFWPVHASGIRPLEWYVQTLIIALPAVGVALWLEIGSLLQRRPRAAPLMPIAPAADDGPRIAGTPALPPHLIDAALCLQMEDHHVRVHTVGRSHLHLAPLHQIAEQLGSTHGMRVHRSWWVARKAVAGWEETGRSVTLLLTNGLRVPVARNRVAQLRAAGWLEQA